MRRFLATAAIFAATLLVGVPTGEAQSLGTFRWQLTPFCNIVTLNVRQDGAVYTLDGFDDQCSAAARASLVGTAFLNPDGSIGFGLTGATAPGAAPVVLYARLDPGSVAGAWSDSAGNSGTMVLTGAAAGSGSPRQVPTNGIRPGSITSNQIAAGAIGAVQIAAGSITAAQIALGSITGAHIANGSITAAQLAPGAAQPPITGQCPVGQYLRGFTSTGQVICEAFFAPNVSTTADDVTNNVGTFTSIAVPADGRPVISHYDSTAFALRITKCGNPACSAGNVSTNVDDPANSVGAYSSIVIGTDGLPVVSYLDSTAGALKVIKCGNASCSTGNAITTVDDLPAPAQVGLYSSIAMGSDGFPVISHTHAYTGGNSLRVTHCGNAACSSGNTSTTVDTAPGVLSGTWSSIAIGADGLPIASHRDDTVGGLRVTHCGNVACTADNVSTTVDDTANQIGYTTSIAIGTDGLAIVSHYDTNAGDLRVTHCGNAACTSGNVSTAADDSTSNVGAYTSIGIGTDGRPVISHLDASIGALRVTHCGNAACTSGNVTTVVDDPAEVVGYYGDLAFGLDGLPVISHLNISVSGLRVTKCASTGCR